MTSGSSHQQKRTCLEVRGSYVDFTEACLDNVVAETRDEGHDVVAGPHSLVLLDYLLKGDHVSHAHGLGQLKVRFQGGFQATGNEDTPLGDISHKQLNDYQQLVGRLSEPERSILGSFTDGLQQVGVGVGVLQLDSVDQPDVVQVAHVQLARAMLGKVGIQTELVGLWGKV